MGRKRKLPTCEIEQQNSTPTLPCGSPHETQSHGASQHPHIPGTSQHSDFDIHANERLRVNTPPMDKTWMRKIRSSREYLQGVIDFLHFASRNALNAGTILCPCVQCVNSSMLSLEVVYDHLLSFGICQGYNCWYFHDETISGATSSNPCETQAEQTHVEQTNIEQPGHPFGDMEEMLHNMFDMHNSFVDEIGDETNEVEPISQGPSEQPTQEPNENAQRFYDLLRDAKQPLYEGCKTFSKLSAIVHWYHLKCLKGLSNETFTMILQTLKAMLPPDAMLPKDCYEAKKIIKDLGLGYEKIHACPKDCMLFWKEHANDDFCEKCGASRWASNDDNLEANLGTSSKKVKKRVAKVLRWLPLKPRLQRLYMALETAEAMKWHTQDRAKDHKMRVVPVRTKPRDVYDVGNGESEEGDAAMYYENEPYNLIDKDLLVNTDENLDWSRNDGEGVTVDLDKMVDDLEFDEDV